jgi:hypothetical protein
MKLQSGYAFTLLLLLAGCGGGGGSSDSGTTQLSLAISDAPVDSVQQVCIAVSRINLNSVTGWGPLALLRTTNSDGCLPDGYAIPTDTSGNPTFFYLDLLKYQNGVKHALLSDVIIPSGTYEQLRLQIEDGRTSYLTQTTGTDATFPASYVKDDSDNILPLEVPSSEVKLHSFTAPVNGVLDYQVEFNLRHAMVLPGHGNYYKLKPNGVELLDVDVLSTISGSVATTDTNCGATALANGDVGVYLYNSTVTDYQGVDYDSSNNGPVLTAMVSDDNADDVYTYQLNYVEAGSYKLALVCNASADELTEAGNSSSFTPTVVEPPKEVQVDPTVTITMTENF